MPGNAIGGSAAAPTMSADIVLYDIPSRDDGGCWSLNVWKTRAALNFKEIPYRTRWTEYPDLAPTLSGVGLPPNARGAKYTAPAVRFPDGTYLMQSLPIAQALETRHPEPALAVDHPAVGRAQKIVAHIFNPLFPVIVIRVADALLSERSAAFFRETRGVDVGMPLAEYAASDQGGENAWAAAAPGLQECVACREWFERDD